MLHAHKYMIYLTIRKKDPLSLNNLLVLDYHLLNLTHHWPFSKSCPNLSIFVVTFNNNNNNNNNICYLYCAFSIKINKGALHLR